MRVTGAAVERRLVFESVMSAVSQWCVSREITKTFYGGVTVAKKKRAAKKKGAQEDFEEEGRQEGREEEDQKGEEVSESRLRPCTERLGVMENLGFLRRVN
jgi:hypothetical protein